MANFPGLSRNEVRLFLTSATLLFTELLLIRWIPAKVIYVGFFSNFLLMACFVGMGAGILLGRGERKPPRQTFAWLLLAVVFLVTEVQLDVQFPSSEEIFFQIGHAADVNLLVLPLVVLLAMLLSAALAMPLGGLLRSMPPLKAYAIDILGSLAGIAGFAALSWFWQPPLVWFSVLSVLLALLALGEGFQWASLGSAIAMACVLVLAPEKPGPHDVPAFCGWSPYYHVTTYEIPMGYAINANGIPHQFFGPTAKILETRTEYDQIYRWFPGRRFERVLVIGAGNGLDVAIQLAKGAGHVDAVEIDPFIANVGKNLHPDRPYARTDKVELTIDDGRAFLERTDREYDLIIFGATDSLTLVTSASNLRIESFLFTREAFEAVRRKLAPGGVFVLSNVYWKPWLVHRIARTLEETFGAAPLLRYDPDTPALAVFADGPLVKELAGQQPPGGGARRLPSAGAPEAATDDWPFPYLHERGVPRHYLIAIGLYLVLATALVAAACRASGLPVKRLSPHFFALGVAFLLLETRSLVTFSLLFGTTWTVNALAFFAILLSVLLAILVNARVRLRAGPLYGALFVSLAVGFFLPPERLIVGSAGLRYVLASAVAFAPIFFANLVFTRSFKDTKTADTAFASNLLGAACGGALEYVALATGYRALLVVVAVAYAGAALLGGRFRVLGDRELGG